MLIDWFTVFAQIVNFLVLVYLLKRFLYGPIINAMDRREERIALRLEEAEQKKVEAVREMEAYQQKNKEFDRKRDQMLASVKQESEKQRKDLIQMARTEVDDLKSRWHNRILQEKNAFLQDLRRRAGRQIYAVVRRALTDLADADLENRIIDVFVRNLETLGQEDLRKIRESIRKSGSKIVITCAFGISEDQRQRISEAVHHQLSEAGDLLYITNPDLLCGIELKAHAYIIGWNLEDYLKSMEEDLGSILEQETVQRTDE